MLSSATIESVTTSFHGAVIDSTPMTIGFPEALDTEIKVALRMAPDASLVVYSCVMETAQSIGVGACVAVSTTAADVQSRGSVVRMGVSPLKSDGVARTTTYVHVAVTDGRLPWPIANTPPRMGDLYGSSRVLAASVLPRTITFR
jgi:hypothetical protein